MSADNYNVVRKCPEGGYFWTIEFASDEKWRTDEQAWRDEVKKLDNPWNIGKTCEDLKFISLSECADAAAREYSEYGLAFSFAVDVKYEEQV